MMCAIISSGGSKGRRSLHACKDWAVALSGILIDNGVAVIFSVNIWGVDRNEIFCYPRIVNHAYILCTIIVLFHLLWLCHLRWGTGLFEINLYFIAYFKYFIHPSHFFLRLFFLSTAAKIYVLSSIQFLFVTFRVFLFRFGAELTAMAWGSS